MTGSSETGQLLLRLVKIDTDPKRLSSLVCSLAEQGSIHPKVLRSVERALKSLPQRGKRQDSQLATLSYICDALSYYDALDPKPLSRVLNSGILTRRTGDLRSDLLLLDIAVCYAAAGSTLGQHDLSLLMRKIGSKDKNGFKPSVRTVGFLESIVAMDLPFDRSKTSTTLQPFVTKGVIEVVLHRWRTFADARKLPLVVNEIAHEALLFPSRAVQLGKIPPRRIERRIDEITEEATRPLSIPRLYREVLQSISPQRVKSRAQS